MIDNPSMRAGVGDTDVGLVSRSGLAIVQMLRESRQLLAGSYVTEVVSISR